MFVDYMNLHKSIEYDNIYSRHDSDSSSLFHETE